MGIRILSGSKLNEDDRPGACFYESTSNEVFGPVFPNAEEAEGFLEWCETRGIHGREIIERATDLYRKDYLRRHLTGG